MENESAKISLFYSQLCDTVDALIGVPLPSPAGISGMKSEAKEAFVGAMATSTTRILSTMQALGAAMDALADSTSGTVLGAQAGGLHQKKGGGGGGGGVGTGIPGASTLFAPGMSRASAHKILWSRVSSATDAIDGVVVGLSSSAGLGLGLGKAKAGGRDAKSFADYYESVVKDVFAYDIKTLTSNAATADKMGILMDSLKFGQDLIPGQIDREQHLATIQARR
jgi:hypothetical protein